MTLIGLISKHGILIIEFANSLQRSGVSKLDAVVGAACTRLRPILMTTAAMVLGVLPLVFATGAGAMARFNMGLVIATGISIGTLFTLFRGAGNLRADRRTAAAGSGGRRGASGARPDKIAITAGHARSSATSDALADADAHAGQRMASAAALQFQRRRAGDARARHAERMAQRNGAAVRVHPRIVVGDTEVAQHSQSLAGESLVQLDRGEIPDRQAQPAEQLLHRHRRTEPP